MLLVPDPAVERVRPPLSIPRRWIGWAGLASVLLHAAVLGAALWWMRQPRVMLHLAEHPATVQLVMSPPGSDHNAAASVPAAQGPEATPGGPAPAKTAPQENVVQPRPAEPPPSQVAKPAPQPAEPAPPEAARQATATAAKPAPNPFTLNLGAVESDTNAWVTGNIVVPPRPDIKFHNRKPSYPQAAALRGEHGAVLLLVHVQPDGLVGNVEVAQSSGYATLDNSARDTVLTWHFLPSVKNGQPIASELPVRIVYALDF